MKRATLPIVLLLALITAKPVYAGGTELLVQSNLSSGSMNLLCLLKGCKVSQTIHGSPNNFYVISVSGSSNAQFLSGLLRTISGIQSVVLINTGDSPLGNRFIVRTNGGLLNLQSICNLGLCQVIEPLDGTLNQVFLLAAPSSQDPSLILAILRAVPGVLNVELD